jgi:predicted nucleic acid-binding Zn ribbon protein
MRKQQSQPLGEIIRQILHEQKLEQPLNELHIIEAWTEVLGKTTMDYTTELSIKNKTLFAHISSPALRHELFIARAEIKTALNQHVGNEVIKEVILR